MALSWRLPAGPLPGPEQNPVPPPSPSSPQQPLAFSTPSHSHSPAPPPALRPFPSSFTAFPACLCVPSRHRSSPLEKKRAESSSSLPFYCGLAHSPLPVGTPPRPIPTPCSQGSACDGNGAFHQSENTVVSGSRAQGGARPPGPATHLGWELTLPELWVGLSAQTRSRSPIFRLCTSQAGMPGMSAVSSLRGPGSKTCRTLKKP